MKEKSWGRIINMASVAGTLGGFGQASYSTTKAGIIGFTKTVALEGARHGINCNVVCPGIINSESFRLIPSEMRERLIKRTAFRKPGEPEDVANAIVFLASDKAKYITGIVLNVSGGIELLILLSDREDYFCETLQTHPSFALKGWRLKDHLFSTTRTIPPVPSSLHPPPFFYWDLSK